MSDSSPRRKLKLTSVKTREYSHVYSQSLAKEHTSSHKQAQEHLQWNSRVLTIIARVTILWTCHAIVVLHVSGRVDACHALRLTSQDISMLVDKTLQFT